MVNFFLSNFSECYVEIMAETVSVGECKTQLPQKSSEELQESNAVDKGAESDSQKSGGTENDDKVSINVPNSDQDHLDSPVKKLAIKKKFGKHAKLSSDVRAKMEEERLLKKECDALEAELVQTQKIQHNIDKYRKKNL